MLVAVTATIMALALLSAPAGARPPQLKSAGATDGIVTATWSLPPTTGADSFQVAKFPDVNAYGYFQCNSQLRGAACDESSLLRFGVLDSDQTSLRALLPCAGQSTPAAARCDSWPALGAGTYYLHIAGHDRLHDGCAQIEFSDMIEIAIQPDGTAATTTLPYAPGTGDCTAFAPRPGRPASGGDGGGGTKFNDTTPPVAKFRYSKRQDIDKLRVRARMSEPGTLTAKAIVDVGGLLARVYTFRTASRRVTGGVLTTLRLKVSKKNKRALKRAMRRGKRLRARVTLTAVDRAGNTTTKHATIRLKR